MMRKISRRITGLTGIWAALGLLALFSVAGAQEALIIFPERYRAAALQLENFHETVLGIDTGMITIESIYQKYGDGTTAFLNEGGNVSAAYPSSVSTMLGFEDFAPNGSGVFTGYSPNGQLPTDLPILDKYWPHNLSSHVHPNGAPNGRNTAFFQTHTERVRDVRDILGYIQDLPILGQGLDDMPNLQNVVILGSSNDIPPSYYLLDDDFFASPIRGSFDEWIPTDFFYSVTNYDDFITEYRLGRIPVHAWDNPIVAEATATAESEGILFTNGAGYTAVTPTFHADGGNPGAGNIQTAFAGSNTVPLTGYVPGGNDNLVGATVVYLGGSTYTNDIPGQEMADTRIGTGTASAQYEIVANTDETILVRGSTGGLFGAAYNGGSYIHADGVTFAEDYADGFDDAGANTNVCFIDVPNDFSQVAGQSVPNDALAGFSVRFLSPLGITTDIARVLFNDRDTAIITAVGSGSGAAARADSVYEGTISTVQVSASVNTNANASSIIWYDTGGANPVERAIQGDLTDALPANGGGWVYREADANGKTTGIWPITSFNGQGTITVAHEGGHGPSGNGQQQFWAPADGDDGLIGAGYDIAKGRMWELYTPGPIADAGATSPPDSGTPFQIYDATDDVYVRVQQMMAWWNNWSNGTRDNQNDDTDSWFRKAALVAGNYHRNWAYWGELIALDVLNTTDTSDGTTMLNGFEINKFFETDRDLPESDVPANIQADFPAYGIDQANPTTDFEAFEVSQLFGWPSGIVGANNVNLGMVYLIGDAGNASGDIFLCDPNDDDYTLRDDSNGDKLPAFSEDPGPHVNAFDVLRLGTNPQGGAGDRFPTIPILVANMDGAAAWDTETYVPDDANDPALFETTPLRSSLGVAALSNNTGIMMGASNGDFDAAGGAIAVIGFSRPLYHLYAPQFLNGVISLTDKDFADEMLFHVFRKYHMGFTTLGSLVTKAMEDYVAGNSMTDLKHQRTLLTFSLLGDPVLTVPQAQNTFEDRDMPIFDDITMDRRNSWSMPVVEIPDGDNLDPPLTTYRDIDIEISQAQGAVVEVKVYDPRHGEAENTDGATATGAPFTPAGITPGPNAEYTLSLDDQDLGPTASTLGLDDTNGPSVYIVRASVQQGQGVGGNTRFGQERRMYVDAVNTFTGTHDILLVDDDEEDMYRMGWNAFVNRPFDEKGLQEHNQARDMINQDDIEQYYESVIDNLTITTGQATFSNGSKVVTGTGTRWATSVANNGDLVRPGYWIKAYPEDVGNAADPIFYRIASVDSDTQLTLDRAWTPSATFHPQEAVSGQASAYTIVAGYARGFCNVGFGLTTVTASHSFWHDGTGTPIPNLQVNDFIKFGFNPPVSGGTFDAENTYPNASRSDIDWGSWYRIVAINDNAGPGGLDTIELDRTYGSPLVPNDPNGNPFLFQNPLLADDPLPAGFTDATSSMRYVIMSESNIPYDVWHQDNDNGTNVVPTDIANTTRGNRGGQGRHGEIYENVLRRYNATVQNDTGRVVVWASGQAGGGFLRDTIMDGAAEDGAGAAFTERDEVTDFLDEGGHMLLAGENIGTDFADATDADNVNGGTQWYTDYLHASFVQQNISIFELDGVANDDISNDLRDVNIQGGFGSNAGNNPSEIDADTEASPILFYSPAVGQEENIQSSGAGGLRVLDETQTGTQTADYALVYLAFNLDAVDTAVSVFSGRNYVFKKILRWLRNPTRTGASALAISPSSASLAVNDKQTFTASGGEAPYTWTLSSNQSGSPTTSGTGPSFAYQAGANAGTDTLQLEDNAGSQVFATIEVSLTGLVITPSSASVTVNGAQTFTASGGTGSYTWTLDPNQSGSATTTGTGAVFNYVAGPSEGTDILELDDGNTKLTAVITVTAGPALAITPSSASVAPNGAQTFTASGGTGSYTWTLDPNQSGSATTTGTGAVFNYVAGPSEGTDILELDDGNTKLTAAITVTAGNPTPPPTPPKDDKKGTLFCFVATAAYGTVMEKEVVDLRRFRDMFLETSDMGRQAVATYYRNSPPLAKVISKSEVLRAIMRDDLGGLVKETQRFSCSSSSSMCASR